MADTAVVNELEALENLAAGKAAAEAKSLVEEAGAQGFHDSEEVEAGATTTWLRLLYWSGFV